MWRKQYLKLARPLHDSLATGVFRIGGTLPLGLPLCVPAVELAPVEHLPGHLKRLGDPLGRLVEDGCVPTELPGCVVGDEGPCLDLSELGEEPPQLVDRGAGGHPVH